MGMEFDYSEIRKLIKEKYATEEEFAKAIGLGRVSLSQKFNNAYDFTRSQMINILNALELPLSEIDRYFFTPKVQEVGHDTRVM